MIFHFRNRAKPIKVALINALYKVGVKPAKMVNWFGMSRATIYRHLRK